MLAKLAMAAASLRRGSDGIEKELDSDNSISTNLQPCPADVGAARDPLP